MTAKETTGARDLRINTRHRLWGFNCPATDIDFLMIEYDQREPVALIDYKDRLSSERWEVSANTAAICKLADRAAVPFFVVRYCPITWRFRVYSINDLAKLIVPEWGQLFQENEFVALLYKLRGRAQ